MGIKELCYKIESIPDLSLNKYSSLDENDVNGVLNKHLAFLRQWNRKGALGGTSIHLYYYYDGQKEDKTYAIGSKGNKLMILFVVRGEEEKLNNVPQLVSASTLSGYFRFTPCTFEDFLKECKITDTSFSVCSTLIKKEVFIKSPLETSSEDGGYYTVPRWEMNENGRLYNMSKLMESLDKQMLYRIDLYPVEKSSALRDALRKPISILHERQYSKASITGQRDFEAENVLKSYDDLFNNVDSSPHFIANTFVFANDRENSAVVLDSAGAEALMKGNYEISTFTGNFNLHSFLDDEPIDYYDTRKKVIMKKGQTGLIICKEESQDYRLKYLPTLFTLEEVAPFFRFPALYEGEAIQKRKETAPIAVPCLIISFYAENDKEHHFCEYEFKLYEDNIPKGFICLKCKETIGNYACGKELKLTKDGDDYICPHCHERIHIESNGMFLGTDDNGYDVYFPLKNLSKHAFIAGVPGSGKTNTMHHLTSTLWKKHCIPFLVLEPAKQEYRALVKQKGMEEVYIFAPNADMSFPLHINPFEFPKGLMLAEHIRRLCSVFEGSFPLDNPMPFLLDQAIEAIYRDLGWTPEMVYTDETTLKFPTMSMLYKRLEDELKTTKYSEEIRGNLESALKVRIGSLLRREMGDVFDVPNSTIPPEKWLTIPAVIELESMGTGPANFLTLMLCTLIREALKVNPHHDKNYARHVIFIEEAHNLIGPVAEETFGADANPKQAATAFVVKMLAEVRALEEGIVIADQLPTVMAQEVIKNTGLKIALRITSADDRGLLGSTMAANSLQLEEMATFSVGRSLISYEGLMRPFTIQTHEWCGNWSTPQCDKNILNTDWCKTNCPYYENGDCEPLSSERSKITTSPSDTELVEIMRDRAVYREICKRSFIIESTRFSRDYTKLNSQIESMIEHVQKINLKKININKLETRVYEMCEELVTSQGGEKSQNLQAIIESTADHVGQLKLELNTKYLSSEKFTNIYNVIIDAITLARRIQDRKKHWIKLGITDFENINTLVASGAELTQIQKLVLGVNKIQKGILLISQQLFIVARPHLIDADSIHKELEKTVYTFKAKNILPKSE